MRKYHHLGIPTLKKREGEVHLKHLKIYVSGYKDSPYRIEWMRYEPDAPYPELVKTIPHVAFEVDDLEQELQGKKVIISPNSPSPGVTVAFIEENGAPVEFLQIDETQVETPKQSLGPMAGRCDAHLIYETVRVFGRSPESLAAAAGRFVAQSPFG